jgi:hypothetical protein
VGRGRALIGVNDGLVSLVALADADDAVFERLRAPATAYLIYRRYDREDRAILSQD